MKPTWLNTGARRARACSLCAQKRTVTRLLRASGSQSAVCQLCTMCLLEMLLTALTGQIRRKEKP